MKTTKNSIQELKVSHEKDWHRTQWLVLDTLVSTPKVSKIYLVKRVSRLANVPPLFCAMVIRDMLNTRDLKTVDESYISIRN